MKRLLCVILCIASLLLCGCSGVADMVIEAALEESGQRPGRDDWDDWDDDWDDKYEKDREDAWEDKWEKDREERLDGVSPARPSEPAAAPTPTPDPNELGFEIVDGEEPIEIETCIESDWLTYCYAYDSEYLYKIFGDLEVSAGDIKKVVKNNPGIGEKYEEFVLGFVDDYVSAWPEAELRVMYENFRTLEIVECTEQELMMASLSVNSAGCYVRTENRIYILEGDLPREKTWDYQVIYHELCHAARSYDRKSEDFAASYTTGLDFWYVTCDEALNSLFAVSLFDYTERDVAYQLQSNYYSALLASMGNYTLADYMNHSCSYFAAKLDETTGHTNYASVMIQLMEAWYDDYHDDKIYRQPEVYYPLYDYVSELYYAKRVTADMSYDEARAVADELWDKLSYDVPAEYELDKGYFYECFDRFFAELFK